VLFRSAYTERETQPLPVEDAVEEAVEQAAPALASPELAPNFWPEPRAARKPQVEPQVEPEPFAAEPESEQAAAEPEPEPEPAAAEAGEPAAEPEPEEQLVAAAVTRLPIGVMAGADGPTLTLVGAPAESDHQPTGDELLAAAEAADLAGDSTTLRSLLLWTARAYAREGRFEAGLDATHRLLQRAPSDVDAHLVLVELYVARSWDGLAADKLRLLGRLADLSGDEETRQRLNSAAVRAFPNDESMQKLCS
jgi:hypothetical protein